MLTGHIQILHCVQNDKISYIVILHKAQNDEISYIVILTTKGGRICYLAQPYGTKQILHCDQNDK